MQTTWRRNRRVFHAPCRHCNHVRRIQCRGLCASCSKNPEIRDRYPAQTQYRQKDDGKPTLPILRTYPDTTEPGLCPCGREIDGACARCERKQRHGLAVTTEDNSLEDISDAS